MDSQSLVFSSANLIDAVHVARTCYLESKHECRFNEFKQLVKCVQLYVQKLRNFFLWHRARSKIGKQCHVNNQLKAINLQTANSHPSAISKFDLKMPIHAPAEYRRACPGMHVLSTKIAPSFEAIWTHI